MDLDTFMTIVCLAGSVIAYCGYRWFNENVYLRYAGDRDKK